ncbi:MULTISPECIES: hypothetical protein [Rhodococcus]|nr:MULTISPECIES: hypothetical protein [Rhodococcus]
MGSLPNAAFHPLVSAVFAEDVGVGAAVAEGDCWEPGLIELKSGAI